MSEREINTALMDDAYIKNSPTARGKILRLLDGDIGKANALAVEHGLENHADYIHKGRPLMGESKALQRPTRIQENDDDAPKGSNPWKPDITDAQGRPDWSPAQRKAQADVTRRMGLAHATRLAESAGSFVGAPRPNAKNLTPRNDAKDSRVNPNLMER
jgi:hypothetical protein